ALADEAGAGGLGAEHGGKARVVAGAAARPLGHAEGDELGVLELRRLSEKAGVGRIGAGPAALDIVDAGAVERLRDRLLVLHAEIDALRLRAVAQRRVEEIDALAGHVRCMADNARG